MKNVIRQLSIALWLGFVSLNAHAKIYSYVDTDGGVHYTDVKPGKSTAYKPLSKNPSKGTFTRISLNTKTDNMHRATATASKAATEKESAPLTVATLQTSEKSDIGTTTTCVYESQYNGVTTYSDEPMKGSICKRLIRTRPKTYVADLKRLPLNKPKFVDLIAAAAQRHQVDERLLHAVIRAESAYNPAAVSSAGAVGLMQLMPATARRYGVTDRTDPEQNVDGGTRYLKDLLGMFNANITLAVAGYNAGEGAVMKYNNSIPPYPETQNYVRQVLAYLGRKS